MSPRLLLILLLLLAPASLLAALAGLGVWQAGSLNTLSLGKCRRGRWGSPCCRCSLAQAAFGR